MFTYISRKMAPAIQAKQNNKCEAKLKYPKFGFLQNLSGQLTILFVRKDKVELPYKIIVDTYVYFRRSRSEKSNKILFFFCWSNKWGRSLPIADFILSSAEWVAARLWTQILTKRHFDLIDMERTARCFPSRLICSLRIARTDTIFEEFMLNRHLHELFLKRVMLWKTFE